MALLDELAGILAPVLGWDAAASADEVAQARLELHEVHGVDLGVTSADSVHSL